MAEVVNAKGLATPSKLRPQLSYANVASTVCLFVVLLLSLPAAASASFPGRNGVLAFSGFSLDEESLGFEFVIDRQVFGIAPISGAPRIVGVGRSPAFSPSGRTIAYAAADDSRAPGIWLARSDCRWPKTRPPAPPCSKLRRLTHGESDSSPAWSPNGKRIAFVRRNAIYTVRAAGGHAPRRLVAGADPDWSSTGALAFVRDSTLFVRQRDGQIQRVGVGSRPTWAPDGQQLAFISYEFKGFSGSPTLSVSNADGTGWRKLWQTSNGPLAPTWSPDGRSIALIKAFSGGYTGAVQVVGTDGTGRRVLIGRFPKCGFCFDNSLPYNRVYYDDLAWQRLPTAGLRE